MVVKAQSSLRYSPVDYNRHSTYKAVYSVHADMYTNDLLAHCGCHYCKQVLQNRSGIKPVKPHLHS